MNTVKKTFIAIAVTGILTGGSLAALAGTAGDRAFEGFAVKGVVALEQLPAEVRAGSIKIKDDDERAMASQARITSSGAARIATTALPGKVVKTEMEDENGYLIWEVEVIGSKGKETKLKIDAGNGYLLAAEKDDGKDADAEDKDESKHSSWKFWEDNDKGEHKD